MKRSLLGPLAGTLVLFFAASQSDSPKGAAVHELGWLSGRWVVEGEGQYIEETWSPAREDAMVGCLRWARKGNVWLYELMSIERDDGGGLVFRLRHFGRGLEPWKAEAEGPLAYPLASLAENEAVFENPGRSDPRRFVYSREGDELSVRLETPDGEATNAFRFKLAP